MKTTKTFPFIFAILSMTACKQDTGKETTMVVKADTLSTKIAIPLKKALKKEIDTLQKDLMQFVPANYSISNAVSGDLNLDGRNDQIIVIEKISKDSLDYPYSNDFKRSILILLRNDKNILQLVKRNDYAIYNKEDGGIMGDPFNGITINKGCFSIEHYGGSAWRWTQSTTFKYSKRDKEWYLHKDESHFFHAADTHDSQTKIKTTKDFGVIKFEEYNIENKIE